MFLPDTKKRAGSVSPPFEFLKNRRFQLSATFTQFFPSRLAL